VLGPRQFNKLVSAYLTNTTKKMMDKVAVAIAQRYKARVQEDLTKLEFQLLKAGVQTHMAQS